MGYEYIRHGGNALRHVLGVLLLAWRHIVRAAGIAFVVGFVGTEIVGVITTHHFPPYLLTHVVAIAVGIAVAYCVGLTVLVDELIKGTRDLVRMALGEAEAGARAAAIIAEREVGDVWGWARRLAVGRDAPASGAPRALPGAPGPASGRVGVFPPSPGSQRPSARTLGQFPMPPGAAGTAGTAGTSGAPVTPSQAPTPSDPARLRVPPRLGASPSASQAPRRDETLEDVAATEVFRKTAPPARADAHPVRADRLPRIEWAAEGLAAGTALLQSVLAARARSPHEASEAGAGEGRAPAAAAAAAEPELPVEALPPLPPLPPRVSDAAAPPSPAMPAAHAESAPVVVHSAPATVPLAPMPVPVPVAAPPTVPLEAEIAPAPSPQPRSSVRTVPVITDDTTPATLEAAQAAEPPDVAEAADAPSGGGAGDDAGVSGGPDQTAPAAEVDAEVDRERAAAEQGELGEQESESGLGSESGSGSGATWEPPSRVIVLPAAEGAAAAQAAAQAADRTATTTGEGGAGGEGGEREVGGALPDDDEEPRGAEERGLWSRIGQALVRSTTRPLRERSEDGGAVADEHAP